VPLRSRRRRTRPNWAKKLWHRSTAFRTLPTPGRFWPRPGAYNRNPCDPARPRDGSFPYAPSARAVGRPRSSGASVGTAGAGGRTTKAASTLWVWHPSLAPAVVTTTASGMARASEAMWIAVPDLPRSTGLGPDASPPFPTTSWTRRGGSGPS